MPGRGRTLGPGEISAAALFKEENCERKQPPPGEKPEHIIKET
jgi:hypothetical protein